MKVSPILAVSLLLSLAACTGPQEHGWIYIEKGHLEHVKAVPGGNALLANAGTWQEVKTGIHVFSVGGCEGKPDARARVSIPIRASERWRIRFTPCGVKTWPDEQTPAGLGEK